ncbi:MAG: hypothetical protein HY558_02185 [Euryarchaeota archaeon]|nr:hypothetical protein [Euryarchaeota archaeon]
MIPRRFPPATEGVEDVMSVLLIFVIFAIGAGIILGAGYPMLRTAQDNAHMQQVEQAFTSLDSKLSKAALGEAPSQSLRLSMSGGGLALKNESWVNISLRNSTAVSDCINVSLRTLEYRVGDRTVAYEGGGVWAKYPSGGSVMLSPPEFHYNGVTLTFPLVNFTGNVSAGGQGAVTLSVNSSNTPTLLYPGASVYSPCGATSRARPNPLGGSNVSITIRSDYYVAWAAFFNRSSLVNVSVAQARKEVQVNLTLQPSDKDDAPYVPPISIPCINQSSCTPLPNFSINLAGRLSQGCAGNLDIDLRSPATDSGVGGSDGLHILISRVSGNGNNPVTVAVDWKNGSNEEYWGPQTVASFTCPAAGGVAKVDLLTTTQDGTSTPYDTSNSDKTDTWGDTCDLDPGDTSAWIRAEPYPPAGSSCYDGKNPLAAGCTDTNPYDSSQSTPPIGYVLQHYIRWHYTTLGALNFQCTSASDDCPGDPNSLSDESSYSIHYDCSNALTYLHVSENRLNISVG